MTTRSEIDCKLCDQFYQVEVYIERDTLSWSAKFRANRFSFAGYNRENVFPVDVVVVDVILFDVIAPSPRGDSWEAPTFNHGRVVVNNVRRG